MTVFIERKNKKTNKIEKKAYETVAERVKKFREKKI